MRRRLVQIALLLASLGLTGFLVSASGIVPITASSGHWPITNWILHFSMRRSIATHTLGLELPALDEPWLVMLGAGHYETSCASCHGSPATQASAFAAAMTPMPPNLSKTVPDWSAEELFYVVKHGVKFTGMPAWPARGRDDEVRAMVAFLRTLPTLDAVQYRHLVYEDAAIRAPSVSDEVPAIIAARCSRCHGADGLGRGSAAFPKLAGQQRTYLLGALRAYAHGTRPSGVMESAMSELDAGDLEAIAEHFANLPFRSAGETRDARAVERGRRIAHEGVPFARIPGCAKCHGPGRKNLHPAYPELRGQHPDYLTLQLTLFRADRRGGSHYARVMQPWAARLSDGQIRDVAEYYGSLSR